ncbi:MAG: ATP synthase F0 subunit B [Clostridia bacterium]|nr:ATP synthase F0 subunit B [Clostridia bacterium]
MDMLSSLGITKDLLADLVINIVSIVVLFLVVKKLAYNPVKKFMAARTEKVMAQKLEAEKLAEEAQAKSFEYEELLKECENAKAQAIKEGEALAREESGQIVSAAKEKAQSIIDNANKKAEEKYNRMIDEANDYIVNLTIDASSKLLKREVNDEDNRKIVEAFLNSVDGDENA